MKGMRGTGSIYKPVSRGVQSPFWWMCYYVRGERRREPTHTTNRREAQDMLDERRTRARRGEAVGSEVARTTFEQLAQLVIDDYVTQGHRTIKRVTQNIGRLREYFGKDLAIAITAARVDAYVAARLESHAARATVQLEIAALRRMFRLGLKKDMVPRVPAFPSLKLANTRTGFFEPADFARVLGQLPEHLRPFMRFMWLTGWRLSEVRSLTWKQVDFRVGVVRLEPHTTKNGRGREFPFRALPELAELLRAQRTVTNATEAEQLCIVPEVFHRKGQPIRDCYHAWRAACRRVGLAGRLMHDLRRTAVRRLEQAGVPRSVAMKLVGHETQAIYDRYAITSPADLAAGVVRVAEYLRNDPSEGRTSTHPPRSEESEGIVLRERSGNLLP